MAAATHDQRFDLVTTLLQNSAGGFEEARPLLPVHASALTDQSTTRRWCGREVLLVKRHKLKLEKHWVPVALRFTWDAGARQQAELTNKYLQAYAWGDWVCPVCAQKVEWSGYPKTEHEHGGRRHAWLYSEASFVHRKTRVEANIDLFVKLPGKKKLRLVEFKILNDTDWQKITMPLAEHALRTRLYLYIVSRDSRGADVDPRRASIVYVSRSHGRMHPRDGLISPFREFVVEHDPEGQQADYLEYLRRVVVMNRADEAGKLPPRICQTPNETRAKHCHAKARCFK